MRALIGSLVFLVCAAPAFAGSVCPAPPTFLSQAAVAPGPSCDNPLDFTVQMLESHGAHLVDLVDVKSKVIDQVAVFVYQGVETMGMVSKGCMVGEPIIVGAEP